MPLHQTIGMLIITAKHHIVIMLVQQKSQCFKVTGSAAFANNNLHTILKLIQCFSGGKTFMVGTHASLNVLLSQFATQAGSMPINRFIELPGSRYFFHHLFILMQYTWEVHHLT